jgi:uncharacterized protein
MMMYRRILLICLLTVLSFSFTNVQQEPINDHYISNRGSLKPQAFVPLPLGAIQAHGWLKKMLELQRDGLTGHLDTYYEIVCGPNNGWLGGTGDGWERGPYWIDGLVPLAFILNDDDLKAKAQEWIEWSIANQREDGYFGPEELPEGYTRIPGTQQGNREDWWPKMVMLKVLQQYYTATNDQRVIHLMTKYFRYQLANLSEYPLGHWTYWAEQRGGDNMQVVLWLYNITQDAFLLELADLLFDQTTPWTRIFTDNTLRKANPYAQLHCVNVAHGVKTPVIYYQRSKDPVHRAAVREGLEALKDVHGFVTGMYGGDEALHGNDPTQGIELCSVVELMYSFESILPVTGDLYYADYLEKVAYNSLPTQINEDFMRRQYFQQVNQVLITDDYRHFDCDGYGRICFGVKTGYPCCLANMHQGWPKFVQNLWYATPDNGLAALIYGASQVKAKVAGGVEVEFIEETNYPFHETIKFTYLTNESVDFPLYLRIPEWCNTPVLKVNGRVIDAPERENLLQVSRTWNKGDVVELELPMEMRFSRWFERSLGVERGPLVYALHVEAEWREVKTDQWPSTFFEVLPKSPWNYGIPQRYILPENFKVTVKNEVPDMPWNPDNTPIEIRTIGKRIPFWTLYNNSAGKLPYSPHPHRELGTPEEEIVLIPYGATTLRVGQIPVVDARIP